MSNGTVPPAAVETVWLTQAAPPYVGGFSNDKMSYWRSVSFSGSLPESVGNVLNPTWQIPIPMANNVLDGLEQCLGPLDVRLYMERHNSTMLAGIKHSFTLVDTGKDVDDLLDLSKNEILLVAGSSYTELAHQMSRGGLTVIPPADGVSSLPYPKRSQMMLILRWSQNPRWWDETGTQLVVKWTALSNSTTNDCLEIRRRYNLGKKRSKAELERVALRGDTPHALNPDLRLY